MQIKPKPHNFFMPDIIRLIFNRITVNMSVIILHISGTKSYLDDLMYDIIRMQSASRDFFFKVLCKTFLVDKTIKIPVLFFGVFFKEFNVLYFCELHHNDDVS